MINSNIVRFDLDIAVKMQFLGMNITYRLDLEKLTVPPTVGGNGYSMSYMANRTAVGNLVRINAKKQNKL